MSHNYTPEASATIPLRNTAEDVLRKKFSNLSIDLWNLTQKWTSLSETGSALLESLMNTRTKARFRVDDNGSEEDAEGSVDEPSANAKQGDFDYGESIVRTSEDIVELLESLSSVLRQMRKALPLLVPLCQCIPSELSSSMLSEQIHQLAAIAPCIVDMFEKELSFKRDSVEQVALSDDPNLSAAILSSWKHSVYIESGPLSVLYSLVV